MSNADVWHAGERELQRRLGVAERMAEIGPRVLSPVLPEQHRAFYPLLNFVVVGAVSANGDLWAGMLEGAPGFAWSPDPSALRLDTRLSGADPCARALLETGAVGLLGIDLTTRRRNRLSGQISAIDSNGLDIRVEQAFGNCPQFIQQRQLVAEAGASEAAGTLVTNSLTDRMRELISAADTCFVASGLPCDGQDAAVDVSHRGGWPGFVRVTGDRLTMPEFSGNRFFNTLGNLLVNPRAGLLFVDFANGDLLQITGRVELQWDAPQAQRYEGVEHLWHLQVERAVWRPGGSALRWQFEGFSPALGRTGSWADESLSVNESGTPQE
ncbi:pyridoxamine 5'-phosphate oxidase family protein [Halopseudomonas aestusnigri]|uniref:pyridoxamine 5'-phosphate oxidase family protein n=1 Tax=Halopseudomonas aestusnigri TaxID=857252 RepID=UPI002554A2A9|nr:pyridoxamine 5'-phosphate oxidase family protein [Halopseudomonas aestusnigri]MDL2198001.1 pyridoxamine 5'-phosphate oxidase family protein [Halopseudomonas aestusnigri]